MRHQRIVTQGRILSSLLLLLIITAASATSGWQAPAKADPGTSTGPVTDPPERNPLPIGMTPEEESRKAEIGTYTRDTAPPLGPEIRQCAEWEPVTGVLVRYPFGLPYNLLAEMAENIELWVLVANQTEQNSCYTALQNNGVNMAHVHFVQASTNSIWTRDYGPQFAFDANGDQGIIDHHYNRPRPLDDVINYAVGTAWGIPVYGSPLVHSGGNYMCDGHNTGFSTDLVWTDNSSLTHAQVADYMHSYLGIDNYRVIQDISTSGIHHIDCWAKLLNEETFIVKQLAGSHPSYTRLEQNVATMRTWVNAYGRPYKIYRVNCPSAAGDVAAYTNGIVLNNKMLVPTFGISADAPALQVYRDAMPGYEVIGFSGSWLSDDAIHCRAMGIHDKYMLRVDVAPLPDTVDTAGDIRLDALVDDRSETGLKSDSLLVFWRVTGAPAFSSVLMTAAAGADSFYAYIPGQPSGTKVEYYVFAADLSNRRSTRPIPAPAGYFSYLVGVDPAAVPGPSAAGGFGFTSVWPNPIGSSANINFRVSRSEKVSLTVHDLTGRQVAELVQEVLPAGGHSAQWDGHGANGRALPDGIYFFRLTAGDRVAVQRAVLLK